MTEATPERLANHPAFHQLIAVALKAASGQAGVNQGKTLADRRAYTDRANALSARVKSGAGAQNDGAVGELGELLDLSEPGTDALVGQARESAKAFLAAFPEYASRKKAKRTTEILIEAVKGDPDVVKAARELAARSTADGGESPETCKVICGLFYLTFLSAAIALMIAGILTCVALGWILPLMVLCIVGVLALFAGLVAILTDLYLNCLANCVDVPWGD